MQTLSMNFSTRHIKALITAAITVIAVAAMASTEAQTTENQPKETIRPIKLEMIRKAVIASRGLL